MLLDDKSQNNITMAKTDKLNKNEMKILKDNYSHLETSAKHRYCMPIVQRQKILLYEIYGNHISKNVPSMSCPRCVLNVMTALYELYTNNVEEKTK